MQLFLNATSPFARVARAIVLEKGLADRVELVWCDPWSNDPVLLAVHPQGRIPVLLTDAGEAISESLLIAHYLDSTGHGPLLVPHAHMGAVLADCSVAYGLMEAAFNAMITRKHDGAQADASVMGQRRLAALERVLQQLEQHPPAALATSLTLATLTTAVALAYVLFRLPGLLPEQRYPQLRQWLAQAEQHPSLASTVFA